MMQVSLADGSELPVAVTRKKVRNLNLRVHADGTVALSVPLGCSAAAAQDFLDRRAGWIGEHVARARSNAATRGQPVPLDGPDAGMLPVWGEPVDAEMALGIERPSCSGGGFAALDLEELQARIDALYRNEVERAIPAVAAPLENHLGAAASRWQVRTMKTRWGSCTPSTGAIRINGALAAYPPECLEYVVAHELVHLVEPSHNERFHALLDELCPNNSAARELLKHPAREVACARERERQQRYKPTL